MPREDKKQSWALHFQAKMHPVELCLHHVSGMESTLSTRLYKCSAVECGDLDEQSTDNH